MCAHAPRQMVSLAFWMGVGEADRERRNRDREIQARAAELEREATAAEAAVEFQHFRIQQRGWERKQMVEEDVWWGSHGVRVASRQRWQ